MADAVVSFAVERLKDLLASGGSNLLGLDHDINDMKSMLQQMQNFVKEVDRKQTRLESVRKLVSDMRALTFRAEDVVESVVMEVEKRKTKSAFTVIFGKLYSDWKLRRNFSKEFDAIKSELMDLTARVRTFGIANLLVGESSSSQVDLKSQRILFSHEIENDFVGREEEIRQILSVLMDEGRGREIISICGMGGIGKTTLARQIYDHEKVRAHFKGYAWVAITQQFNKEDIFRRVLTELLPANGKETVSRMDDAEVVEALYRVQREKRCLIVLDDIWDDSLESFRSTFPFGRGSKILLTTRLLRVAEIGYVHLIPPLTEEESWQLLSKKSRINEIQEKMVAYEMEIKGRSMINMYRGLPLAITLLGGVLKRIPLEKWERIKEDAFSLLNRDDNIFTHILGLSYDSLPLHLKYCFLCFANYKEDEVIETRELYMIWIAEGLISLEDKAEGELLLDVAERYLNELANLSLVQVEYSMWSKPRTCRVHDLVRDFCFSKAREEEFMTVINLHSYFHHETRASTLRRLCICSYDDGDESSLKPFDQQVISHIRSVFVRKARSTAMGTWPDKILSLEKFKVLRVLTVNRYEFTIQNMKNISELIYLKYLCLRHCKCKFTELPSSIANLRNLGTLDLRVSSRIIIPNILWKLKKLKHLYLPEFFKGGDRTDKLRFTGLDELEMIYNYNTMYCDTHDLLHKLRFTGLDELEMIYNYNTMYCDTHDLLRLPNFKLFDGEITLENNLPKDISDYIKSKEFVSSVFEGEGGGKCLISILSKYDHNTVGSNYLAGETSQSTPSEGNV